MDPFNLDLNCLPDDVFIFTFFYVINSLLLLLLNIIWFDFNPFSAFLLGFLLLKYVFCLFSSNNRERAGRRRAENMFGEGFAYLCALYFLLFTASVYYLKGVDMWITTTWHQVLPNLVIIGDDLIQDMARPLPLAYVPCFMIIALMFVPTPKNCTSHTDSSSCQEGPEEELEGGSRLSIGENTLSFQTNDDIKINLY